MAQNDPIMRQEIERCTAILKASGTIMYPTDTVWGLGACAQNELAIAQINEIKQRPSQKSYIVLMASWEMFTHYYKGDITDTIRQELLENDRATTLILPHMVGLASPVYAVDCTVGIRIPKHDFCRRLITQHGLPIVSTSANKSGEPTPMNFEDISQGVKTKVGHCVSILQDQATAPPSRIVKLGPEGLSVIRK